MTLHEDMFLKLISNYQASGLSLDRVITDPRFKALPLAEKVELLTDHGHTIRAGAKTDSRFWKDIGLGVAGTALILADPILDTVKGTMNAYHHSVSKYEALGAGEPFNEPAPVFKSKGITDLAVRAAGAGIAVPKFYTAMNARKNMNMVKSMLKDQPGSNTQEDALNVITRS
jgi:hypothetical protein